jgi:hypothetical protein
MERKARWAKAERIVRHARFPVAARAAELFPLLCPVLEYDWIPDWSCEMIYSKSGVAERDCAFTTRIMPFSRELWTCIVYEPPRRIEYLFTHGSKIAVRLELELSEEGGRTMLDWTMRFTVTGALWRRLLRTRSDEKSFGAMMETRERQLAEYFAARR